MYLSTFSVFASKSTVVGQMALDGPSVYCIVTSISKIPASGAISVIGIADNTREMGNLRK